MNKTISKILGWLRDILPSVTLVGSLIYNYMLRKISFLKRENAQLELDLEYKENEDDVEKANSGKSDSDIIRDAIEQGGSGASSGDSE